MKMQNVWENCLFLKPYFQFRKFFLPLFNNHSTGGLTEQQINSVWPNRCFLNEPAAYILP